MYAHDPIVWLSWRCSSGRVLNFGMILHKLSSNFMHAVLTDGIINCWCRFIWPRLVGAHGWHGFVVILRIVPMVAFAHAQAEVTLLS